ncbi:MAG: SUMF1/EgtB/PvdO family nonheme iron enzyme, partial [Planctomycetota bacterium]
RQLNVQVDSPTKRESPPEEKTIENPFYLGTHEVTVAQFREFVTTTGYTTKVEQDRESAAATKPCIGLGRVDEEWVLGSDFDWQNLGEVELNDGMPVMNVSHQDATAYVQWLSRNDELHNYRLPFQSEWEFAARAGTETMWYYGSSDEQKSQHAWHRHNSQSKPHPVGSKLPNPFGLFDMYGNVEEWCEDRIIKIDNRIEYWHNREQSAPSYYNIVVARGGHFRQLFELRSASRNFTSRSTTSLRGFRVLREITPDEQNGKN